MYLDGFCSNILTSLPMVVDYLLPVIIIGIACEQKVGISNNLDGNFVK